MEPSVDAAAENVAPTPVDLEPAIPWGWVRALISLPVWIVVQVVIMIPTVSLMGIGEDANNGAFVDNPVGIIVQVAQLLSTIITVWALRYWIDRRSIGSLGFAFNREYARDLAAGVACGIALISAIFLSVFVLGGLSVVAFHPPTTSLLILTAIMILVAFNEELYVRGYLLNNLMESGNKYLVLAITSVVFAVFHVFNPNISAIGVANIVLAGLLLGIYYVHKRNLWFPIGLHFAWNLFQGGVYGSPVSGVSVTSLVKIDFVGDTLLTGGEFGFEASLVTTILLAVATLVVHLIYRPRKARADVMP